MPRHSQLPEDTEGSRIIDEMAALQCVHDFADANLINSAQWFRVCLLCRLIEECSRDIYQRSSPRSDQWTQRPMEYALDAQRVIRETVLRSHFCEIDSRSKKL